MPVPDARLTLSRRGREGASDEWVQPSIGALLAGELANSDSLYSLLLLERPAKGGRVPASVPVDADLKCPKLLF